MVRFRTAATPGGGLLCRRRLQFASAGCGLPEAYRIVREIAAEGRRTAASGRGGPHVADGSSGLRRLRPPLLVL